jgi:hypothetical protein
LIKNNNIYVFKNSLKIFACLLITVSFCVPFIQNHVTIFGYQGFGGMFVNDSLGMEDTLRRFVEDPDGVFSTVYGVMFLYSPSYYLSHVYNLIVNLLLLTFAANFFLKTLSELDIKLSPRKIMLIMTIVVFNFYILEVLYFPNKEIPLILLTNAFLYYFIVQRRTVIVFSILVLTLFIRDGHGLVLTLTFFSLTFFRGYLLRKPYFFLLSIFILFSILSIDVIESIGILGDYNYILARNVSLATDADGSLLTGAPVYISYALKVVNHYISSAVRPQFIDLNDRIYIVGIGLWQNGVVIFLGISSWLYLIRQQENYKIVAIGVAIILGMLFISVGTFTQPRYMMPYIFWLTTGFVFLLDLKKILILVLGIFLVSVLFTLLNLGVPIPLGIDTYDGFDF